MVILNSEYRFGKGLCDNVFIIPASRHLAVEMIEGLGGQVGLRAIGMHQLQGTL
jgi:hypothetical protein